MGRPYKLATKLLAVIFGPLILTLAFLFCLSYGGVEVKRPESPRRENDDV